MQEVFSALWQGTLASCNALANRVRVALTHGHSEWVTYAWQVYHGGDFRCFWWRRSCTCKAYWIRAIINCFDSIGLSFAGTCLNVLWAVLCTKPSSHMLCCDFSWFRSLATRRQCASSKFMRHLLCGFNFDRSLLTDHFWHIMRCKIDSARQALLTWHFYTRWDVSNTMSCRLKNNQGTAPRNLCISDGLATDISCSQCIQLAGKAEGSNCLSGR